MASILIVDDEEQVRHLMAGVLAEVGYDVREAGSGQEGLTLYRERPADLVIMDIMMPDQDGLEGIRRLRLEFPAARVIAITGEQDMIGVLSYLDVAKMLGACRTLHKPFEIQELVDAVQAELNR